MLIIKYDIEMPKMEDDWIDNIYKKSWFYAIYNIDLVNFFIGKKSIENLEVKDLNIIFKDFVRFLSKNIEREKFKLCNFEISFIVNNQDSVLTKQLELNVDPKILYLKYTLINGNYERSYQLLENINTIKNEAIQY